MAEVVGEARRRADPRQPQGPPGAAHGVDHRERHGQRGDAHQPRELPLGEGIGRRDVERATGVGGQDRERGPGEVVFVHELQRRVGSIGEQHAGQCEKDVAEKIPHARPADDRRPGPAHGDRRVRGGEGREQCLDLALVGRIGVVGPRAERRRFRMWCMGIGPGAVDGGARRDQESGCAAGGGRRQHAGRALHVHGPLGRGVAARPHGEGEVEDRVGMKRGESGIAARSADVDGHEDIGRMAARRHCVDAEHDGMRQGSPQAPDHRAAIEAARAGDCDALEWQRGCGHGGFRPARPPARGAAVRAGRPRGRRENRPGSCAGPTARSGAASP